MMAGEKQVWTTTNSKRWKLFAPECGGTCEVFNVRPVFDEILQYCTQDVQFLPKLWLHYYPKMTAACATKVDLATRDIVVLSHMSSQRHMATRLKK